jgi:hypothetical protein
MKKMPEPILNPQTGADGNSEKPKPKNPHLKRDLALGIIAVIAAVGLGVVAIAYQKRYYIFRRRL